MGVFCVEETEQKIRDLASNKGIRVKEFFQDFDKNKTGFITKPQFFRVLYKNFGLVFKEHEEAAIVQKYAGPEGNSVDYKYFCCIIQREFDTKNFDQQRDYKFSIPNPYWKTSMDERLHEVLLKIHHHYTARGLSLKRMCSDFDTNSNGKISQTQFYRSFVKPPNFSAEDMILLLQRYHQPDDQQLIRYFDLYEDLMHCEAVKEEKVRSDILCCPPRTNDGDLQSLLERLGQLAQVHQFKTMDCFKVFDTLNKGFIHVSQFYACFDQCFRKILNLSEEDTSKIVRAFERPEDGMVHYRSFCSIIDDAFIEADLEKKPTKEVFTPPPGYFGRRVVTLSVEEERMVLEVLERLRKEMGFYRRPLHYFFKDFDHHINSGQVTVSQFRRVLSLCGMHVHPVHFELLCKKFAHAHSGYVNYMSFLEHVDMVVILRKEKSDREKKLRHEKSSKATQVPQNVDMDGFEMSLERLLAKLRNHVIINRIRVKEFFEDFDSLKTGRVSREQFKRGLSLLGTGSLKSTLNYNDFQLNLIADHFSVECSKRSKETSSSGDNNATTMRIGSNDHTDIPCNSLPVNDDILWTLFACELEKGYCIEDLEKQPTLALRPAAEFIEPKEGTKRLQAMAKDEKAWFDELMNRMAAKILLSNIDMLLIFRNFDKLRHGHVSRLKFRQALGIAGFSLPDELSLTALEAAFYDVDGINYIRFLEEISTKKPLTNYEEVSRKVQAKKLQRRLQNLKEFDCCKWVESAPDVETVLLKVKVKLAKQNIRVVDWFKDFDKFRTGCVSRPNFRRALGQCRFEIDENEVSLLEDQYRLPDDESSINYSAFCDELESIFTAPDIEKCPSKHNEPFKIPKRCLEECEWSEEDRQALQHLMTAIKRKYKALRPGILPFFKDFDKVHIGSVSRNQFRRVLEGLKLVSAIYPQNLWALLCKRFSVQVGGQMDIDYLEFHHWIADGSQC